MNTYYATVEQSETKKICGEVITTKCACGESYAYLVDDDTKVIICDGCYENEGYHYQYL